VIAYGHHGRLGHGVRGRTRAESRPGVSDTTARQRRERMIQAGVFDAIANEALAGYDKVLDSISPTSPLTDLPTKPSWREGTARARSIGQAWVEGSLPPTPRDSHRLGHRRGEPARHSPARPDNRCRQSAGLLADIDTLWLDRAMPEDAMKYLAHIESTTHGRQEASRAGQKLEDVSMGLRWPDGADQLVAVETMGKCGAIPTARSATDYLSWPWRLPSS